MLDTNLIKQTIAMRGLSMADLAALCGVSREAVSNWLSGESIPRPARLKQLAEVLGVGIGDLMSAPTADAPVIAYRTRTMGPASPAATEAGMEIARHLRQLVPYLEHPPLFVPSTLRAPSLDDAYIQQVATAVRHQMGVNSGSVTDAHLLDRLRTFGAIFVPVFWGGHGEGHENAMSVFLPDSRTTWVVLNLNCRRAEFRYWLAHELGHCLSLPALSGEDGEYFAERFAHCLLGTAVSGDTEDSVTVAEHFFGVAKPDADQYITAAEPIFDTPVFRAIAAYQKDTGGKSPAFIAAAFNIGLAESHKLAQALWDRAY